MRRPGEGNRRVSGTVEGLRRQDPGGVPAFPVRHGPVPDPGIADAALTPLPDDGSPAAVCVHGAFAPPPGDVPGSRPGRIETRDTEVHVRALNHSRILFLAGLALLAWLWPAPAAPLASSSCDAERGMLCDIEEICIPISAVPPIWFCVPFNEVYWDEAALRR